MAEVWLSVNKMDLLNLKQQQMLHFDNVILSYDITRKIEVFEQYLDLQNSLKEKQPLQKLSASDFI